MSAQRDTHVQVRTPFASRVREQIAPASWDWREWAWQLAPVLILVVALAMRLYQLGVPFDRDGYDEGVYWQSLLAMQSGQGLYHSIFYSQPPAFLLSIYPIFVLFGGTLWAARLGIVLISMLGFVGAYLLGKTLAGRVGALVALLLLLCNPSYLMESQTLQADGPSVALTLLALGCAFCWWRHPKRWQGLCWAALCGASLALSIFTKLLCVTTLVPVGLLLLAHLWRARGEDAHTSPHPRVGTRAARTMDDSLNTQTNQSSHENLFRRLWPLLMPMLVGLGVALVFSLALLLPFAGSLSALWSSVITFHEAASRAFPGTLVGNANIIIPVLITWLGITAGYGTLTALLRGDRSVWPLLAWLVSTVVLLLLQRPLFPHHLIALIPPLLALAVLGIASPEAYKAILADARLAPVVSALTIVLILLTIVLNAWQDGAYYQANQATSVGSNVQVDLRAASDLRQAIAPDQWVITDGQFIAGLAGRSTPPGLVDTSTVRITSGYVTLAQLEQAASNSRVHAVLFYSPRLSFLPETAAFHTWVAQHFRLLHTYGPGQELWVR